MSQLNNYLQDQLPKEKGGSTFLAKIKKGLGRIKEPLKSFFLSFSITVGSGLALTLLISGIFAIFFPELWATIPLWHVIVALIGCGLGVVEFLKGDRRFVLQCVCMGCFASLFTWATIWLGLFVAASLLGVGPIGARLVVAGVGLLGGAVFGIPAYKFITTYLELRRTEILEQFAPLALRAKNYQLYLGNEYAEEYAF